MKGGDIMARAVERKFKADERELSRGDIVMAYFPELDSEFDNEQLKEFEAVLKHFSDYRMEDMEKDSSVQTGVRPAVVIQNDMGNKHSPVIQLSPITSQSKRNLPTHVSVENLYGTGLVKKSTILVESTRPIDKHFIFGKIGKLSHHLMPNLNRAVAIEYGIG